MYVDECGNPDLESSDNPIHRFLSLTGVIIELVWRYEPYHYCLAILLERYAMFLEQRQAQGDVMAESRGGKEDRKLKDSFSRIWKDGTEYVTPERFQKVLTSKQLKVKPKANNISGLQISDIIAHPSRTEILLENSRRETQLAPFAKKVVAILEGKYYQYEGKIFGKKFL